MLQLVEFRSLWMNINNTTATLRVYINSSYVQTVITEYLVKFKYFKEQIIPSPIGSTQSVIKLIEKSKDNM